MTETETGAMAGRRVLLVEDEYFIVDDLIAAAERLDAAVLDVNLQGEMACPVADALAARGVPFVFATGYDEPSISPRYAHITRCEKPVEPEKIAQALFG